ncbi:MAG: hypothetical protein V4712_04430 [Pseudomonadota bacterium]
MEWLLFLGILPLIFVGSGSDDDEPAPEQPDTEGPDTEGTASFGDDDPAEVTLSDGDDLHLAKDGRDFVEGGGGDDLIAGEQGRDTLNGDGGNDLLLGGLGDDVLSGGDGDDEMIGGIGNDDMEGGAGDDALVGSTGADTLSGGEGDDFLVGVDAQPGNFVTEALATTAADVAEVLPGLFDGVVDGWRADRISNDIQSANTDLWPVWPDEVNGDAGNDTLLGDRGDTLTGGEGVDDFVAVVGPDWSTPVAITDFAPATEVLQLFIEGGPNPATGVVSVLDRLDGLGADVLLDGQVVAVLRGLSAAAVAPDSILLDNTLAA